MTLSEVNNLFDTHPATETLVSGLQGNVSPLSLQGAVGSADAMISAAVIRQLKGFHLFILNDKEDAAYFYNNLENIDPDNNRLFFFPESYRHPYQEEQTDNSNVVLRAEVLAKIADKPEDLTIVSYPQALSERVVTKGHLKEHTVEIKVGEDYSMDFIDELLLEYEFEKVDFVYDPGQFSVRGGIIDVFSFSFEHPFRIVFDGDTVESIRSFEVDTQLSVKPFDRISIVPNVQRKLLQESRQGMLDHIPEKATLWYRSPSIIKKGIQSEYEKAKQAYDKINSPLNHLTPAELYVDGEQFLHRLEQFNRVEIGSEASEKAVKITTDQKPQPTFNKKFDLLIENLKKNTETGYKNLIFSNQPKQIERLYSIFDDIGKEVQFTPVTTAIHEGFIDNDLKLVCYTDHQIFDRYHRFRLKEGFKKSKESLTIRELNSLKKGDFVVHVDHGIGQFSGLEKIDVNGKPQEAIRLVYQGSDILYVSIHSLHRISKYTGKEGTQPKLHKLGTATWANTKKKTKKKIKEIAFDLIRLYAKRKASQGFAFTPDTYLQTELEASFMYEDTPDQEKATIAVKEDMEKQFPMDRLVCGDVGFGKTEIAMRAAFKAATDGKQVAVLVPTTILSLQHFKSFQSRLEDFPVTVDYINRFKSAASQRETINKLQTGEVDIVIGTHKLVGKAVKFKDLGLLIIDEEQKFGVSVKDKLKTLRENVDTLTLTATPIPRTLQFSLMGARDLSIISTPPPNRHPVQTEVMTFNEEAIRDAVMYEINRGGQVFYVNNRIQNIKEVAGMLQRLCPEIRIAIAHGQMDGSKLEEVMLDFMDGQYDVLLATSIIESGIDVPNANTMIIQDAQLFGLSDLHQLRGRVGRSTRKAFCYLITPPQHMLTQDARKRMRAIEQFSDLGSGFNIAMRDLDIRGAGDLLGAEQSGFITDIGYEMYQKILDEALAELRANEFKELFASEVKDEPVVSDCIIETDFEVMIPDDYVNSVAERLQIYRELDNVPDEESLQQAVAILQDRFGPIPEATHNLISIIRLRWIARDTGFEKLIIKGSKLIAHFGAAQESDYYQGSRFTSILEFMRTAPKGCTMSEKKGKLRLIVNPVSSVEEAVELLTTFGVPAAL